MEIMLTPDISDWYSGRGLMYMHRRPHAPRDLRPLAVRTSIVLIGYVRAALHCAVNMQRMINTGAIAMYTNDKD